MTYKMWKVFEGKTAIKYFIINSTTSKVQSVWKSYQDAKNTLDDLNRQAKKAV